MERRNKCNLPLKDTEGNQAAIINFADDLDTSWTKSTEDGVDYYYYNTKLAKDASTTSLIESVTFNKDIVIETSDNCTVVDNTKTCTTTTSGYAGGTYTLTIKVETVQFDQYKDAWSTNVAIN